MMWEEILGWCLEYLCCLLLMFAGIVCIGWAIMRHREVWLGRRWMKAVFVPLAVIVGIYHFLFGAAKLIFITWLILS